MKHRFLYIVFCALFALNATAQERTRSDADRRTPEPAAKNKVMLVPFEPRLYFGEIDHAIHSETRLSSKEINHHFRDGINEQLYKAFKTAGFPVVDLMDDTLKFKTEITGIYEQLRYDYVRVPDQEKYQPPKKEKEQVKIEKGQLNVETNTNHRFMNARIASPKLIPQLKTRHNTGIFVFINQLDLRAAGSRDPGDFNPNALRRITVHYTVFTADGREINSGVAEESFAADLNNPRKIIDRHFSVVASTIVKRVTKGLAAP